MIISPDSVTLNDICLDALREAGVVGDGMQATKTQLGRAVTRLGWVLSQWTRKNLMIFAVRSQVTDCTSADFYSVGVNGDFTSDFGDALSASNDGGAQSRPERLQACFYRQTNVGGSQGPIDYPLAQIETGEDYWARTRMKGLTSWPQFFYYQASYPLGQLYLWPKPQVGMGYQIGVVFRSPLDVNDADLATPLLMPPEYQPALVYCLAMELRSVFQIPSFPGDNLPLMAKNALSTIVKSNTKVGQLGMPSSLHKGRGRYNILSDNYGR